MPYLLIKESLILPMLETADKHIVYPLLLYVVSLVIKYL